MDGGGGSASVGISAVGDDGFGQKEQQRRQKKRQPDFPSAFAEAAVFGRGVFAAAQLRPEFLIDGVERIAGIDEHAVVLAFDFIETIADGGEEIGIGGDDGAIHVEFDHGLRFADRGELACVIGAAQFFACDVGGEFDDFIRLAVAVENGVIAGLDPDFLAVLAEALIFGGRIFAAVESGPEVFMLAAARVIAIDKHAVMTAGDFIEPVASRVEEIAVGGDDGAIHVEFDHRLRFADRGKQGFKFTAAAVVALKEMKRVFVRGLVVHDVTPFFYKHC